MLAALIIVFREVFEAGLIVGIVLAVTRTVAASQPVDRRRRAGGRCSLPAWWRYSRARLSNLFAGMGQELFNAAILVSPSSC